MKVFEVKVFEFIGEKVCGGFWGIEIRECGGGVGGWWDGEYG